MLLTACRATVRRAVVAPRVAPRVVAQRTMGGGPSGEYHVSPWHEHLGTFYCGVMWLWMMYRAKEDGAAVLVSLLWMSSHARRASCIPGMRTATTGGTTIITTTTRTTRTRINAP